MSTTPAKPETPVFPVIVATAMVEILLDQIEPSPYNRKTFSQKAIEELAGSIVQTSGVLQPVVLRPVKGKGTIVYQLVAGERRWLASKWAVEKLKFSRKTISATVKELTDAQAIEITLIENAQREDVHVLELCRTYKALLGQPDSTSGQPYTRELIADRVSKSYSVVCAIMQTEQLIPEVQQACKDGKINSSLAMEIAKYQPKQQEQIFLQCFGGAAEDSYDDDPQYMSLKEVTKDKSAESTVSVRKLREWIARNVHIELKDAKFDPKDTLLLKGVPACTACPKNTGCNPGLFAEAAVIKKGDLCTDPGCYEAKNQAYVEIKIAEDSRKSAPPAPVKTEPVKAAPLPAGVKVADASLSQSSALKAANAGLVPSKAIAPAPAAPVVQVQKISSLQDWELDDDESKRKPDVLYGSDVRQEKPNCNAPKKAIWVDGPKMGNIIWICVDKGCKNHSGQSHSSGSGESRPPVTFKRKMEIWTGRVQLVYRDSIASAIVEAKPQPFGDTEAHIIAEYVLDVMHHQDKTKIRKLFGLKEDKSWDSSALKKYAKGLKGAELFRFILLCCMGGELGLEDQYFGGELKKDDPLAVIGATYKVPSELLLADAKAALEKKRPKSDAEKKAAEKAATQGAPKKSASKPVDAPKKPKTPKTAKPAKKKAKAKK